jgi:hypothetical protein
LAFVIAAGAAGSLLASSSHGVVTVPICDGAASLRLDCWRERAAGLVRAEGVHAALADLNRAQRRYGYVRAACHQLTHAIGRAAGARWGIMAIERGDRLRGTCAVGYPHGVVEAVMSRITARNAVARVEEVCASYRSRAPHSSDHYNCTHGLGHGLMFVFHSDVQRSLQGCDALRDPWERDRCSGGVFMENVTAIDDPQRPSTALRPNDPLYPCPVVRIRYKKQCYQWQTAYVLYVNDTDFAAGFRVCAHAEPGFRVACDAGLGRDAAAFRNKAFSGTATQDLVLRQLCALGATQAARVGCVAGAVSTMVTDVPVTGIARASAFCASYARPRIGPMHSACLTALNRALREDPLQGGPLAHPPTFFCPLWHTRQSPVNNTRGV